MSKIPKKTPKSKLPDSDDDRTEEPEETKSDEPAQSRKAQSPEPEKAKSPSEKETEIGDIGVSRTPPNTKSGLPQFSPIIPAKLPKNWSPQHSGSESSDDGIIRYFGKHTRKTLQSRKRINLDTSGDGELKIAK